MDGDDAAATERADVGPTVFVEGDVPGGDAAWAVVEDAGEGGRPPGPVGEVIAGCKIGAAFGPVHLETGVGVPDLFHLFWRAGITVPGDGIDIGFDVGHGQYVHHATDQIV